MEVVEIKKSQKEEWNHFVAKNPYGSFLQSFEWGEFQQSLGRDCWKLKVKSEKHAPYRNGASGSGLKVILGQTLVVKYDLPFGKSYLYSPHGPIIDPEPATSDPVTIFKALSKKVKEIAQEEKAIFWRMDPAAPDSTEERTIFKELGLQKLSREIQPKKTLILDLTKSEKEILSQMHSKTRYNIRLAERKGVTAEKITNYELQIPNLVDVLWGLIRKTAKRDGFRSHPKEYYRKMLESLSSAELFLAKYKGRIIAANIVVFFGKCATYVHGASDYKYRNLMAPHFLQWRQILEAKKKGLVLYDFWGIDEKKWPGVTRFKKGFGGKEINYIGAWDLIYQPTWYKIYNLARRIL